MCALGIPKKARRLFYSRPGGRARAGGCHPRAVDFSQWFGRGVRLFSDRNSRILKFASKAPYDQVGNLRKFVGDRLDEAPSDQS